MKIRTLAPVMLMALVAAGCETTGSRDNPASFRVYDRSVQTGQTLRLNGFYNLTRDCKNISRGRVVSFSTSAGGVVSSRHEMAFPTYPNGHSHRACNGIKSPGTAVYYQPRAGFRGTDVVRFQVAWPDGDVWTNTVTVEVK
jgi:hypothetical protein